MSPIADGSRFLMVSDGGPALGAGDPGGDNSLHRGGGGPAPAGNSRATATASMRRPAYATFRFTRRGRPAFSTVARTVLPELGGCLTQRARGVVGLDADMPVHRHRFLRRSQLALSQCLCGGALLKRFDGSCGLRMRLDDRRADIGDGGVDRARDGGAGIVERRGCGRRTCRNRLHRIAGLGQCLGNGIRSLEHREQHVVECREDDGADHIDTLHRGDLHDTVRHGKRCGIGNHLRVEGIEGVLTRGLDGGADAGQSAGGGRDDVEQTHHGDLEGILRPRRHQRAVVEDGGRGGGVGGSGHQCRGGADRLEYVARLQGHIDERARGAQNGDRHGHHALHQGRTDERAVEELIAQEACDEAAERNRGGGQLDLVSHGGGRRQHLRCPSLRCGDQRGDARNGDPGCCDAGERTVRCMHDASLVESHVFHTDARAYGFNTAPRDEACDGERVRLRQCSGSAATAPSSPSTARSRPRSPSTRNCRHPAPSAWCRG